MAAVDWVDAAEKRGLDHMNTSKNSFVKLALLEPDDAAFGAHSVKLEIFSDQLPLSSSRFLQLCQGKTNDESNPGYLGSSCTRVQKGDFLQFGKLEVDPSKLKTFEDEAFIYNHEEPGMVGFVG